MFKLKLEFEENEPDKYPRVSARIIIEGYQLSQLSGMPAVTRDCDVSYELDNELRDLKSTLNREIGKVEKKARKRFDQYEQKRRSAAETLNLSSQPPI
ncbi:hypothetical protein ACO2JO_18490 [Leptospira interrogans]